MRGRDVLLDLEDSVILKEPDFRKAPCYLGWPNETKLDPGVYMNRAFSTRPLNKEEMGIHCS